MGLIRKQFGACLISSEFLGDYVDILSSWLGSGLVVTGCIEEGWAFQGLDQFSLCSTVEELNVEGRVDGGDSFDSSELIGESEGCPGTPAEASCKNFIDSFIFQVLSKLLVSGVDIFNELFLDNFIDFCSVCD